MVDEVWVACIKQENVDAGVIEVKYKVVDTPENDHWVQGEW